MRDYVGSRGKGTNNSLYVQIFVLFFDNYGLKLDLVTPNKRVI